MKIPEQPHSREAEESIIGSVLINPNVFYETRLDPKDFYIIRNGWVWEAFRKVVDSEQDIDFVTVAHALGDRLEEIGGPARLTVLTTVPATSLNAESYAAIIRDMSNRRRGLATANKVATAAYNLEVEYNPESYSLEIVESGDGNGRKTTKEAASEAIDLVMKGGGITTGVKAIDNFTGGYFIGEVSILAGRPGAGKSALMKQSAMRNADEGKKVLLISSEESAAQVWLKIACGSLGINPSVIRKAEGVSQSALTSVFENASALGEKYNSKIVIYEDEMTPLEIYASILRERPDIVFVDTISNIVGIGSQQMKHDFYDDAIRYLRAKAAKKLNCHICFLHHINRDVEKQNRKPTKADLSYAGEKYADNVHILHRDQALEGASIVELDWIYAKGRFGAIGTETIYFNLPKQSFHDSYT